jgi:hypothetical protein
VPEDAVTNFVEHDLGERLGHLADDTPEMP